MGQFQQDQTSSYGRQQLWVVVVVVVVNVVMVVMMVMTTMIMMVMMTSMMSATLSFTSDYTRQLMSATDVMQAKLSERQVQRNSRRQRTAFSRAT